MKKLSSRLVSILVVVALVACFSTTAFAATATISPGGNASAFFSKEVNNYVYINQQGAGNHGTAIGMLWYLYSQGNDVIGVSDYMTGATTGYVYKTDGRKISVHGYWPTIRTRHLPAI